MNHIKKETTFLQEGNVKVTDRRVLIGTETYALSNIRSANFSRQSKSKKPLLLIPLGILLSRWAAVTDGSFIEFFNIGVVLVIVGIVVFLVVRPPYTIHFETVSGRVGILNTNDMPLSKRIVDAINTAIAGNKRVEPLHQQTSR